MRKKGHLPIRTCMGCRRKRKKEEMIRFIKSPEGVIKVNGKKPHPGRGFYLCPDLGCLHRAEKKNRGIGFLEIADFQAPPAKSFYEG
jgi:predicted RNA-binding protein YlxR (DUF448 family)